MRVLGAGQFFQKESFGPDTVNRGAVLMECEWHGGVFESGIMMGGIFRGGQFRNGRFWGGVFWEGEWLGGVWECGFDCKGHYHPRTDHPPFV